MGATELPRPETTQTVFGSSVLTNRSPTSIPILFRLSTVFILRSEYLRRRYRYAEVKRVSRTENNKCYHVFLLRLLVVPDAAFPRETGCFFAGLDTVFAATGGFNRPLSSI